MTQRIGIEINTQTTGGAGVKEQIRNLRELHDISAQFEDLRSDAMSKYPDDLKRQNEYIREQINLLRQLETAGSREHISSLRREMRRAQSTAERNRIKEQIEFEQREHVTATREFVEAQAARIQWARDHGVYDPKSPQEKDMFSNYFSAGVRGGGRGLMQTGMGQMTAGIASRLAGMSTVGKLVAGTGIGTALYGLYKGVQFFGEGVELNRQTAPEFTSLATGLEKIPASIKNVRNEVEYMALSIGKGVRETINLEREWMRLGGTTELANQNMRNAVMAGLTGGIDAQMTVQYLGTMARTGYQPEELNPELMTEALATAEQAGMTGFRRQEFIQQIQGIMPGMLNTAVTLNPEDVISIAGQFAELGLPFQGERGTNIINQIQGGFTQQNGLGWEAARRVLSERGEETTPAAIRRQQELGITDFENLKTLWEMFTTLGGNEENAAYLMGAEYNIPTRALWNPDEEINSIGEMLAQRTEWEKFTPEEKEAAKTKIEDRIKEYEESTGFMTLQNQVATEIGKIETAATAFEAGVKMFHDSVSEFVNNLLLGKLGQPPIIRNAEQYKATTKRVAEAYERTYKENPELLTMDLDMPF